MSSSSQAADSWISSFCNLLGHEYFAEVSEDFIEDDFNLTGLSAQVPLYKEALEMVLDVEPEDDDDEEEEDDDDDEDEDLGGVGGLGGEKRLTYRRAGDRRQQRLPSDTSIIEASAEMLYGLIHQRYITSRAGMQQMYEKYELGHFGACPRVYCDGCRVLPVGCSDVPGQETVKLFCPSCLDVYTPPNSRFQTVDGAFFGTTFGSLFFMTFPDVVVSARLSDPVLKDRDRDRNRDRPNPSTASPVPQSASSASGSLTNDRESQLNNALSPRRPPIPAQPLAINGMPTLNLAPGLGADSLYEPRIYGFRVAERSKTGPRMKWLRMRPADITELDEVTQFHEHLADLEDDEIENGSDINDGNEGRGGNSAGQTRAARGTGSRQDAGAEINADPSRRKKAPMRRRRSARTTGSSGAAEHGYEYDGQSGQGANGINGVG